MALRQVNVKRMLAFSGISHAGFMLMTILSISNAAGTLLYYTAAYALAGIAAFSVILYVCKTMRMKTSLISMDSEKQILY
jgi:NADH-quinone oxidoreductase subunit N